MEIFENFENLNCPLTLVDDVRLFRDAFVCEWDDDLMVVVVSVGAVVVAVGPDEFVI